MLQYTCCWKHLLMLPCLTYNAHHSGVHGAADGRYEAVMELQQQVHTFPAFPTSCTPAQRPNVTSDPTHQMGRAPRTPLRLLAQHAHRHVLPRLGAPRLPARALAARAHGVAPPDEVIPGRSTQKFAAELLVELLMELFAGLFVEVRKTLHWPCRCVA